MKRVLSILAGVFLIAILSGQTTHYVGESFGGGIVFYVYDGGKHGLITASVDKSTRIQRQKSTALAANEVADAIGKGKFSTESIGTISGSGAEYDDTQVYFNYQDSYYSDWYLPSKYELSLLYLNRAVLGGYNDFAKGWSSIEDGRVNAWFTSFATGGTYSNGHDDIEYIRVHRRF